jgi:hypothetical protein
MRTYPTVRRAIAFFLAVTAGIVGIFIMIVPDRLPINFVLGVTDVLLGISIILGIVVIRSHYD